MLTLVVSLVVVSVSVAAVLRLALADPAQPAMDQGIARRARAKAGALVGDLRRRREGRAQAARMKTARVPVAVRAPAAAADLDQTGPLRRLRSAVALLLLLALVGTLLATAVGLVVFVAGLALRSAVS